MATVAGQMGVCQSGDLTSVGGSLQCTGTWAVVTVPAPFNPSTDLDAGVFAQAFAVGFVLIATISLAAVCIRKVVEVFK